MVVLLCFGGCWTVAAILHRDRPTDRHNARESCGAKTFAFAARSRAKTAFSVCGGARAGILASFHPRRRRDRPVNSHTLQDPPSDLPTLVEMLQQASELEHALCCQYLYAAFTLKSGGDPGVTASTAELSEQWGHQISKIAIQEMYHLMLASNLLTAVGAEPHLWRPNFPYPSTRFSDVDLPSLLAPFNPETAQRFMCWEKPDVDGWWTSECASCARQARARLGLAVAEDVPTYDSIGALYGLIKEALRQHPEWIDPSTADKQVTSEVIPFSPKVAAITTYEEAAYYIDVIVTEGEGGGDYESQSHFAYFHQIVVELGQIASPSPPSWPAVENPIYDAANVVPGANLVDDPDVQPVGAACADIYLVFVRLLSRLFIPEGETADERQALANTATAMMPLVIKPLGVLLTRLPAGPAYPGLCAGPSFELPAQIELPAGAHVAAIGDLLGELEAVTEHLRVVGLTATGLPPDAVTEIATIAARLQTLLALMSPPVTGAAR
jgi:hypothetical protein